MTILEYYTRWVQEKEYSTVLLYSIGRRTIAEAALVHWMVDGIDTQGISTAAKVHDRLQIRFTVYLHLSITIVLITVLLFIPTGCPTIARTSKLDLSNFGGVLSSRVLTFYPVPAANTAQTWSWFFIGQRIPVTQPVQCGPGPPMILVKP